jgi:hypothetical protein
MHEMESTGLLERDTQVLVRAYQLYVPNTFLHEWNTTSFLRRYRFNVSRQEFLAF